MNQKVFYSGLVLLIVSGVTSCAPVPAPTATQSAAFTDAPPPTPLEEASATTAPEPSFTAVVPITGHTMTPADSVPAPDSTVPDVTSSGSGAPYGDSYKINRFERPFQKDMEYIPDLDIITLSVSQDSDWHYASIELSGTDPNNSLGIHYGVELDLDSDGYGDYMIWAHPPYGAQWDTSTVQVFQDSNHDSAGPAGQHGNGYDELVFEGASSETTDPDLAWVRMVEGPHAFVQFAFKTSWIGSSFLIGAVADAGLKDLSKFDYNIQFDEKQAGSPVRNSQYYPLGKLYAVDNTCWQPEGLQLTTYEPKFCPAPVTAKPTHKPGVDQPTTNPPPVVQPPTTAPVEAVCTEEPDLGCGDNGFNPDTCQCNSDAPTDEPIETQPAVTDPPVQPTEPPVSINPPPACKPDFDPAICDTYDPDICQCV